MKTISKRRVHAFIKDFIKHDKIDNPNDDYDTRRAKALKLRSIIRGTSAYTYKNESIITFKEFIQEPSEEI